MSKIKAKELLICAGFGLFSIAANAQTLDSLITKQREAMIEEANKKGLADKGVPNASAAPQQLQISQISPIAQLPALPGAGMPGVPGSEVPPPKPITKAVFNISDAKLVAVYGVGENLMAEIAYNGLVAKVTKQVEVIDGWVVQEITGRSVLLGKVVRKGKTSSTVSHILRFNQGTGIVTTETVTPKIPKAKKSTVQTKEGVTEKKAVTLDQIASKPVTVETVKSSSAGTSQVQAAPVSGVVAAK